MSMGRITVGLAAMAVGLGLGEPAYADETAALPEVQDLLPLASILDRIMPAIEGEIGASRLIKDHGVWVYVIGFFDENGKPQELRVDATTAQILSVRQ